MNIQNIEDDNNNETAALLTVPNHYSNMNKKMNEMNKDQENEENNYNDNINEDINNTLKTGFIIKVYAILILQILVSCVFIGFGFITKLRHIFSQWSWYNILITVICIITIIVILVDITSKLLISNLMIEHESITIISHIDSKEY